MEEKETRALASISTKGGTGKTTVAISLALELSKAHKVGLLDADVDSSNVSGLLGLEQEITVDIDTRKLIPLDYKGIKVFSMSSYLPRKDMGVAISGVSKTQFLRDAIYSTNWGEIDLFVIDCPGGSGDEFNAIRKILPKLQAIIVTQPNTLEDCSRIIDLCNNFKIPILGIVENMSGSWMHGKPVLCNCGCGKEFTPFGKNTVKEKFPDIAFLGSIPLCQEIFETNPPEIPKEFNVIANIIAKVV